MEFRILGPLEVADGGSVLPLAGAKQRGLLAILLLRANAVVSSDRLIEELWGEQSLWPAGRRARCLPEHQTSARGGARKPRIPPHLGAARSAMCPKVHQLFVLLSATSQTRRSSSAGMATARRSNHFAAAQASAGCHSPPCRAYHRTPAPPSAPTLSPEFRSSLCRRLRSCWRDLREIAQALFVTEKTIEWHLRQTYRKLDGHSRHDLPRAFTDAAQPTTAALTACTAAQL